MSTDIDTGEYNLGTYDGYTCILEIHSFGDKSGNQITYVESFHYYHYSMPTELSPNDVPNHVLNHFDLEADIVLLTQRSLGVGTA